MEAQWVVDRAKLRDLHREHPEYSHQQLADLVGRSRGWVKKWLKRFHSAVFDDDSVLFRGVTPSLAQRKPHILDIRDNPPDNLRRTPGPKAILYYLSQRDTLKPNELPRSTRTIWKILDTCQRIARPQGSRHEPVDLLPPMMHWQIDFKDASTVTADPNGKQAHILEIFDVVDVGTSTVLDSLPNAGYNASTVIMAMCNTLLVYWCR